MQLSRSFSFGTKPLPPKPTAFALGLVGLSLLVTAGFVARSTYRLQQIGIRTQGEVVALERSESTYFPVFTFHDLEGRELTVRSSTSSKNYLVGDSIPILYEADSPLDARIDEPVALYLLEGILGLLGIFFLFGMVAMWKLLPLFERAYDAERAYHDDGRS